MFAGGGEMGRRIAALDWSKTALGPIDDWPQALIHAVSLLLPAGTEIVLFWGPDYIALYNDAYAPTIGDKHPAALGCPARECWNERWGDLEPLLAHVRTTGETYSAKDRPFYIERAGFGEEVYFDISYSAVRTGDGGIGGVLCIVSETTARVRAGRDLLLSSQSLELANDVSEIGTWDLDLVTNHLAWSARSKAMFGVAPDASFLMKEFWGAIHREDRAAVAAAFEAAVDPARRALYDVEYRIQGIEDGIPRWIAAKGRGVFEDDRCVRAIGTTADISRQKRGEESLRESEERFRHLADTAPALIWLTDAQGDIVFTNRWFQTLLGISAEEMARGGWLRLMPADDRARIAAHREAARRDQAPFGGELRVIDSAGNDRWVHAEGRPRFLDGVFQGFIGCAVDVTEAHLAGAALERRIAERTAELADANRRLTEQVHERERVEATLQQMQRLEAVGQLTAGVAHDFNNLLTVVLGNVEMLERTIDPNPKALQRLAHVRSAAERGAALTAQLLAFARRARLEAKTVDLNEAVAGMRTLLGSTLGGTISIDTRLAADLAPALVDPTQIELIILNLAINARDAMAEGGIIAIETANATLGAPDAAEAPAAGEYVMVAVADEGTGMPPEVLARVFEPFFTTKPVGKGSGLGLAQVYGFAKQSGGGVRIETAPGAGTTVRVYLPRSPDALANAAPIAAVEDETGAGGETILVLDDDDAVRAVTADSLRTAHFRVIEAVRGDAALEALAAETDVALVVADFAMPGMNGAEFARLARKITDVPVLFVTGYADLSALADVAEERIVRKPYRATDLVERVRMLLK